MRFNSELCVNLDLLKENIEKVQNLAPSNKIIFMVKGDAYGHGLLEISRYAFLDHGIDHFGVASIGEALILKKTLPQTKIYVFSDIQMDRFTDEYFHEGVVPVISNFLDLECFISHELFKDHPFCLKFNTGMNRLGFDKDDLGEVKKILIKYNCSSIHHLMTHFSHSFFKIKEGDKTTKQYELFCEIKSKLSMDFKILESSVSNSGAIEQEFGLGETHIRPGIMLYGPASIGGYKKEPRMWTGKIISSLKTKIMAIRAVKRGEPVGYGGHIAHKEGLILILPLGYADGVLTYYSGLKFKHKGFDAKILGRVNMDLTLVHIDCNDESQFTIGEDFIFWDESQERMLDFCTQVKTIPYQVFTAITSRVPRKYYDK